MQVLIGSGILTWEREERQSIRYGAFYLGSEDYECNATADCYFSTAAAENFCGKRCKVTFAIVESRPSGHCGDMTLKLPESPKEHIKPTQPTMGQEFSVVGIFGIEPCEYATYGYAITVQPSDGRNTFWIDPRILYQIHDQTVNVFVEETDEPDTPLTDLIDDNQEGKAYTVPDDRGFAIQTRVKAKEGQKFKVLPKVERIGDGLVKVEAPSIQDASGTTYNVRVEI